MMAVAVAWPVPVAWSADRRGRGRCADPGIPCPRPGYADPFPCRADWSWAPRWASPCCPRPRASRLAW